MCNERIRSVKECLRLVDVRFVEECVILAGVRALRTCEVCQAHEA